MGELAIRVRSRALVPLVFPAHLQLQPSGVFAVQQVVHVDHGHFAFPSSVRISKTNVSRLSVSVRLPRELGLADAS